MIKRPHYIALAAVVLLVLILFRLPSGAASKLKLAVGGFFVPLFGVTSSTHSALDKAGDQILPRSELIRQNEQLRRENDQLRLQAHQADEIGQENAQLRALVGWQRQVPWKLKLTHVIARDPANWWRTIQIDLGSRDGVQVNFPVLTIDGLIGRVSAVGTTRSQVILLGDSNLRVGAVVSETAKSPNGRETGVITANSANPFENNMVTLSYLSGNSGVKPGQTVETSADGGIFPAGIPIGRIVDTRSLDYGLTTEARVALFAKMNSLEDVWVLFVDGAATAPRVQVPAASPHGPQNTKPESHSTRQRR